MSAGGPKPSAFYVERQATTRSPATPSALSNKSSNFSAGQTDPGAGTQTPGDGLVLANLMAVVVSVYPQPNFTITGGSLLCWVYNPYQAAWTRCFDLDQTIGTTVTGPTGYTVATLPNPSRLGMLINFLCSSITGTTPDVLVRIDGFNSVLGMGS